MRQPPWPCTTEGCGGVPTLIGELTDAPGWDVESVFDWLVDDANGTTLVLRAGPHCCPAGGGGRLGFAMMGNWD
jgi:hypothetical protein